MRVLLIGGSDQVRRSAFIFFFRLLLSFFFFAPSSSYLFIFMCVGIYVSVQVLDGSTRCSTNENSSLEAIIEQ